MKLIAILFLFAAAACAQTATADLTNLRTAKGDTLSSPELPKLKLKFKKPFKYVGGHTFILYEVARAEQHFYVDADKDGNVQRLYWVQFEGYLPSNKHTYNYQSPEKVNLGGLDFYVDAYASKIDPKQSRADSDGNRARAFLAEKGFKMASDDVMFRRLVNMVTPDNRSELMIIYMEALTPTRFTAADLSPNGKAADKWPAISAGLRERATKGIEIIR